MREFDVQLGGRVKTLREGCGFSQDELASRCGMGRLALGEAEKGRRKIYVYEAVKLAGVFRISVDELVSSTIEAGALILFCPLTQKKCRDDCAWCHFELGCVVGNVTEVLEMLVKRLPTVYWRDG